MLRDITFKNAVVFGVLVKHHALVVGQCVSMLVQTQTLMHIESCGSRSAKTNAPSFTILQELSEVS